MGGKWWQLVLRGRKKSFGVFSVPYLDQGAHNCQNFRKDSSGRVIMFVNLREINMEHLLFMSLLGKETSFLPHYNRFHVLGCSTCIWQSVCIIVNSGSFFDPWHLSCKNMTI